MIQKIVHGFVVQLYNKNGIPTSQEFFAADEVEWENEYGEPLNDEEVLDHFDLPEGQKTESYLPFDMKQPDVSEVEK